MARVKIIFPSTDPVFESCIPLRITDMNYGNHLGNDSLLSVLHEARVQWLHALGCSELDVGGCGLIMADAMIAYKSESFYGDELLCTLFVEELKASSFDILYRVTAKRNHKHVLIATAKTGMVCYDYHLRKITPVPEKLLKHLDRSEA